MAALGVHLLLEILPPVGKGGFGDPGGVSTRRSWGRWKSYRRRGVPMVAVTPERLCDDCNATGVRHGRWMGHRN